MTTILIARDSHGRTRRIKVGKVLHKGGGAGRICAVKGERDSVVKLYHDPARARHYRPKIEAMLARPPDLPAIEENGRHYVQIAWPTALLEDTRGRFLGFAMPFIDLSRADSLDTLLVKALRRQRGWPENYGFRLFAAQNVAAMVAELHRLGHHVIDLKPQNLSVYKENMYVAVVDCDGLSIKGADGQRFPGHQFTDGYRAPEGVRSNLEPERLGEKQDRFALAVVLFQLLNNGIHPFQGVPRQRGLTLGTEQQRINRSLYAYGGQSNPVQGPSPSSLHTTLEDSTLQLFERAFDKTYRPSAREWRDHLRDLIERPLLVRCRHNPEEHAHFSKGCGLCQLDQTIQQRATATKRRPVQKGRKTRPRKIGPRIKQPATAFPRRPSHGPAQQTQAPRTSPGAPGLLRLPSFGRLLFGVAQPAPTRQVGLVGLVIAYLTYCLFMLNLLAVGLVTWTSFEPREFYWLVHWMEAQDLLWGNAEGSVRSNLGIAQMIILFYAGCATVLALWLAYLNRVIARGTLAENHGTWIIRTFWLGLILGLACGVLTYAVWPLGAVVPALYLLWLVYRCTKGLWRLLQLRGLPDPRAIL